MPAEKPETDSFLVSIERKIAALQALAESYKAAVAIGALGHAGDDAPAFGTIAPTGGSTFAAAADLPRGIFLGKSMPGAIKLLFTSLRRKLTGKEVTASLREGGFESTARNFDNTVVSTMHRMKDAGELLRFNDGAWGLAELYPESLRMRITKEAKPPKGGKKVRKSPQRKGAVKAAHGKAAKPDKTKIVLHSISAHTGVSPDDVYAVLKLNGVESAMNYVFNVLSRLRAQGKIEKRDDGKWYIVKTAAA